MHLLVPGASADASEAQAATLKDMRLQAASFPMAFLKVVGGALAQEIANWDLGVLEVLLRSVIIAGKSEKARWTAEEAQVLFCDV